MYQRLQTFNKSGIHSFFLWGARQTGKSTLLRTMFPDALWFDLLQTDVFQNLLNRPATIREIINASTNKTIVIDEIQKIPILLNEVHWLIENAKKKFILSGSSPRKILRSNQNLLGGRALKYELYPLSYREIPDFDLNRALNHGLIPNHYIFDDYQLLLSSYVTSYLEDEIQTESRIRNLSIFSNFLHKAAFSNGETVNYSNIAADCGVSSPTVKEYFQILVDTMLGSYVHPFQKRSKRQTVSSPKFYFFDIGIVNHLLKRHHITPKTELYGNAFEHFIFMEFKAHAHYTQLNYPITFWRTTSQFETDFVLGDHEIVVEVKSGDTIHNKHLKNLRRFKDDFKVKQAILVCNERFPRVVDDIQILPWNHFLDNLWGGQYLK